MKSNHAIRLALLAGKSIIVTATIVTLAALAQPSAQGKKYALLVGVEQYDPDQLNPVKFANQDVGGLADVLRRAGYDRIVVMTQELGAKQARLLPTAEHVRAELGLLVKNKDETDTLLVGLIGHGVRYRGSDESYFCPADANVSGRKNLIAYSELFAALDEKNCKAGMKLLVIDACRNDPLVEDSRARPEVDLPSVTRPEKRPQPGGFAAFFSCSPTEKAWSHSSVSHGVFSHYLIQALEGAADFNRDGAIELPEVETFVKKEVFDFVADKYRTEQTPEMINKTRGPVPLVRLDRPKKGNSSWQGWWSETKGFVFVFTMDLNVVNGEVDGQIHWTLKVAPSSRNDMANRIGNSGIEYVTGTYTAATRELKLQGNRVSDNTLLATDQYRLKVSERGNSFEGKTRGNEERWDCSMRGTLTSGNIPANSAR